MTKPYHITPEQALKLFDEAGGILDLEDKCPIGVSATDLANFANAVLDEVLGEPVGEVVNLNNQPVGAPYLTENGWTLKVGQRLYTPKELK